MNSVGDIGGNIGGELQLFAKNIRIIVEVKKRL